MASGEEAMITQKQVIEAVREFRPFSETALRKYIHALMQVLSDEELAYICFNTDNKQHQLARVACRILDERLNNHNH
jgi:hypothetical protein